MKEIQANEITDAIARLCKEASVFLPDDVVEALEKAMDKEESSVGKGVLASLLENSRLAQSEGIPLCQDCGFAVVYLELGQDARVVGGDLYEAVNEGVRKGYTEGYLRKSIVRHPFSTRDNTRDNTPAVINTEIVPGDGLKITVMPKGGGCENMSRLAMLSPAQGRQGIIDFVVRAVEEAGSNPCPPIIVGVGIGGTAEHAMHLAKKSLLRKVGERNPDPELAELEGELLEKVNKLGIGPEGLGGRYTALGVNVETFPSHIASLPVAINLQCNSARFKEATL